MLPVENLSRENWSTFDARLLNLPVKDRLSISHAYDRSKRYHARQKRESGERYFEHPRAVALILIDECGILDSDIIIGALFHDVVEDTDIFEDFDLLPYSLWLPKAQGKLKKMYGERAAEIILAVTKPKIDGIDITTKEESNEFYINNLAHASPEALLVKMADRLHNLRTLSSRTSKDKDKIILETREIYYPIFQRALVTYAQEGTLLLKEMELAIQMNSNTSEFT